MTTSALQNMLPRRRVTHPARDEFDLSDSENGARESSPVEVDEDADELSFIPSKKQKAASRPATTKKPRPVPAKPLATKTPLAKSHTPAKPTKKGKQASSKTHARRLSNKENEVDDDGVEGTDRVEKNDHRANPSSDLNNSGIMDLPEKERRKLNRMVRKFREVDKWELAFEDVTASSSSPRDAR